MFFWILVFFIFGSAVGSFLNVVIDRTTRGESILGRSYCDHCKASLKTVDLIPIISFFALGAKCRYCKKHLSWQYPVVEGLAGILFVISFIVLSLSGLLSFWSLTYWLFLISISVIVAVVDLKYSLIPTTLVFLASLVALFYNFFAFEPGLFIQHIITAFILAVFFLIVVLITRGRGMGEGDVVLAFLIGMVLGVQATFVAMFIAFLLGAVISVLLILLGKKHFGQTVPFGPFLVFGFIASLFWANPLLEWYLMLY